MSLLKTTTNATESVEILIENPISHIKVTSSAEIGNELVSIRLVDSDNSNPDICTEMSLKRLRELTVRSEGYIDDTEAIIGLTPDGRSLVVPEGVKIAVTLKGLTAANTYKVNDISMLGLTNQFVEYVESTFVRDIAKKTIPVTQDMKTIAWPIETVTEAKLSHISGGTHEYTKDELKSIQRLLNDVVVRPTGDDDPIYGFDTLCIYPTRELTSVDLRKNKADVVEFVTVYVRAYS